MKKSSSAFLSITSIITEINERKHLSSKSRIKLNTLLNHDSNLSELDI